MTVRPVILALVGPTASGKSALAMRIAEQIGGEIISADSRQVFRYLDIGTAKPSAADRQRIPHHFVDILDPSQEYSAGQFGIDARALLSKAVPERRRLIVAGGSGLYVKAIIDGLFDGPVRDPAIRHRLQEELHTRGPQTLFGRLQSLDPAAAATMDATKTRRVIRALEVIEVTGRPLSAQHADQSSALPFEIEQWALAWDRRELYRRIEERVDAMLKTGLVDEVRRLQQMGYDPALNALNTVGYKEAFQYLSGRISSEEMVSLIKQQTRRFAKRQLTWFRADRRIHWEPIGHDDDLARIAEKILRRYAE